MFSNVFKDQKYLGGGCYAQVHRIRPGWVLKHAPHRDGTLNYLEWCLLKQAAGEHMDGMPEIDFLVHTENGYLVTMREYTGIPRTDWGRRDFPEREYLDDLVAAFETYMVDTFNKCGFANDLHGGNAMIDADGEYVLTDPSSLEYLDTPCVEHFELETEYMH
jgi:hypothetical protein